MAGFKKQKKEETKEFKEQFIEAAKDNPDIDEVEIKTKSAGKQEEPQATSLIEDIRSMPDEVFKANVLGILIELVQEKRAREQNVKP